MSAASHGVDSRTVHIERDGSTHPTVAVQRSGIVYWLIAGFKLTKGVLSWQSRSEHSHCRSADGFLSLAATVYRRDAERVMSSRRSALGAERCATGWQRA